MSDRLKIGRDEAQGAPGAGFSRPAMQRGPGEGTLFGHVGPVAQAGGAQGIWAHPKLLLTGAGIAAAIAGWVLVDGIGGFWRYEVQGVEEMPIWVALLFIPGFCALFTALVASVDDIASGAFARAATFGAIGLVAGAIGGVIAQFAGGIAFAIVMEVVTGNGTGFQSDFKTMLALMAARVPGWVIAGALAGAGIGGMGRSLRRAMLGAAGGAAGGLIGGLVFDPVNMATTKLFDSEHAAVSRLLGLMAVGGATGFAIAFAEDAAKSAWLVIERGRLIGKQFIIYRNPTRIGAAYSNDVFLFKDPAVQQEHAHIARRGGSYVVDAQAGALVRVNGRPIVSSRIQANDVIQVGETMLRFMTKAGGG